MARMDANQRHRSQRCSVAGVASKLGYARHRPEDTVLYQVVEHHVGSIPFDQPVLVASIFTIPPEP